MVLVKPYYRLDDRWVYQLTHCQHNGYCHDKIAVRSDD